MIPRTTVFLILSLIVPVATLSAHGQGHVHPHGWEWLLAAALVLVPVTFFVTKLVRR